MKTYEQIEKKTKAYFKRITGLSKRKFKKLRNKIKNYEETQKSKNSLKRRGLKTSSMSLEDRLLLTLYYLRHYSTFANLANVFNISESYCYKIYKNYATLIMEVEKQDNSKKLLEEPQEIVVIDVAEQPIERPVKEQKSYYSGKVKRHTIKAQIIFSPLQKAILSVFCGKGQVHDFQLFKQSGVLLHPDTLVLADSGYQGLEKYHAVFTTGEKEKRSTSL